VTPALLLLLLALGTWSLVFAGLYWAARRLDNYGIVDVAWACAFAPTAMFYAAAAPGWLPRRLLIAALVALWSIRLGSHLWRRVAAHHPREDGRYVQLRRDWANAFAVKMTGFFQLQALSVVLLSVPFLLPALNPAAGFHPLEIAGAVLWLLALAGEATADAQLAAFQAARTGRDRVCDVGLWRYSRHPNYFFEWLVWVAAFLFALGSPHGWVAALAPVGMLFLLWRVTGIPLTEEQALRSKGDAYRRYQQTTSAFVPWFPRPPGSRR
jgi:steroid 5-alpha reductase family enzyme